MVFDNNEEYKSNILGRGSFGTVYRYQDKAIKQYHRWLYHFDKLSPSLKRYEPLKFKLMRARGPKIKYTYLVEDLLYINDEFSGVIYPYIEGETLYKVVSKLSYEEKYDLAKQIIRNAKELTDNAIYPADYRLPNILRDTDGNIRIIDLDDFWTHISLFPNPIQLAISLTSLKKVLINFLESDDFWRPTTKKYLEKFKESQKLGKKLVVSYKTLQQYVDNRLKPFTTIFINIDDINLFQDLNLEAIDKITSNTNCKIVLFGMPKTALITNPNISIYDCINSSFDDDELIANYLNANNITNHLFFDKELLTNDSDLDTETISKSIKSLKQNRSKTKKIIRAKNL